MLFSCRFGKESGHRCFHLNIPCDHIEYRMTHAVRTFFSSFLDSNAALAYIKHTRQSHC